MNTTLTAPPPVRAAKPSGGHRAAALMGGLVALPCVVVALLLSAPWRPPTGPAGELLPATHPMLALAVPDPQDRWVLVQIPPKGCTGTCTIALADAARRVHVALYKQMPRVRRVWLGDGPDAAALATRFPDLMLRALPADWQGRAPGLYVIDPTGHAVLRHPAPQNDTQLKALLRDINRLLKYSWLG